MKRLGFYLLYLLIVSWIGMEFVLSRGFGTQPLYETQKLISDLEAAAAARNRHRVLILGDSFSTQEPEWGYGALLDRHFESDGSVSYNLAKGGYGVYDYWENYLVYGSVYEPHLVIVTYYVGNDLSDAAKEYDERKRRFETDSPNRPRGRSHVMSAIRAHLANRAWESSKSAIEEENRRDDTECGDVDVLNPWLPLMARKRPAHLIDNLMVKAEYLWEFNRQILTDLKNRVEAQGGRVVFVIAPRSVQIDRSHYAFFEKLGFQLDPRFLTTQKPQDLFLEFCRKERATCVDLLPHFRARAGEELYLSNDDHWNAAGSRLAFSLVIDALE